MLNTFTRLRSEVIKLTRLRSEVDKLTRLRSEANKLTRLRSEVNKADMDVCEHEKSLFLHSSI